MFAYLNSEQKKTTKGLVQKKRNRSNLTGIPDKMKAGFENFSGLSFDDVRVNYNSNKPAQLQAFAFTRGNQVYIAPGQEKHLGHELGHVIQQKQGRVSPTMTMQKYQVNDSAVLEREADMFAEKSKSQAFTTKNHNELQKASSISIIQRRPILVGIRTSIQNYVIGINAMSSLRKPHTIFKRL